MSFGEVIELSKFGNFAWLLVLLVKQKDKEWKICGVFHVRLI